MSENARHVINRALLKVLTKKPETADIIADRLEWLEHENTKMKKAMNYCLGRLKAHHTTKPGITTLIRKTEKFMEGNQ